MPVYHCEESSMSQVAEAVYEQGVLRLLQPICLPEHTRVQVEIRSSDEGGSDPVVGRCLPR